MSITNSSLKNQQAPCGRMVDCAVHQDRDDDAMVTEELEFSCGCLSIRHEYHDGSLGRKVVRHDGAVLVDELLTAE